jgi:hypothetical protein
LSRLLPARGTLRELATHRRCALDLLQLWARRWVSTPMTITSAPNRSTAWSEMRNCNSSRRSQPRAASRADQIRCIGNVAAPLAHSDNQTPTPPPPFPPPVLPPRPFPRLPPRPAPRLPPRPGARSWPPPSLPHPSEPQPPLLPPPVPVDCAIAGELRLVESNMTSDGGTPIANLPALERNARRSA